MSENSLVKLSAEVTRLEAEILQNDGELTPEIERSFDLTQGDLKEKVDRYHRVIDAFEHRAAYFASIEAQAKAARKLFERHQEKLKNNLRYVLSQKEDRELRGYDHRYVLIRGKERLVINDSLPEAYMKEQVSLVPDKEKITGTLDMGFPVPGASYEPVESLRCYFNSDLKKIEAKDV